jgi:hypothetical protein
MKGSIRQAYAATTIAAAAIAVVAAPATAQTMPDRDRTFGTRGEHVFEVPAGVSTIDVEVVGEQGEGWVRFSRGGYGARITGDLSVTGGEVLYVNVGVGGAGRHPAGGGTLGGGASDIRLCSATAPQCDGFAGSLYSRLIVAGGGGGGDYAFNGGDAGENGGETACGDCARAGRSGGISGGGLGGTGFPSPASDGESGGFGVGGIGGRTPAGEPGSGGGGGWFGGGGSGSTDDFTKRASGGGGSNFYGDRISNPEATTASDAGGAYVRLKWRDEQPPAVTLDRPAAGARVESLTTVSGTATHGGGDDKQVLISLADGSTAANITFAANVDPATGAWSATVPTPLHDGRWDVWAEHYDEARNYAFSGVRTVAIDSTAPALAVDGPVDGALVEDRRVEIRGRAGTASGDEPVDVVVRDSAGATLAERHAATTGARWTLDADLPDGTYTIEATQRDDLGHVSAVRVTFEVKARQPAMTPGDQKPADGSQPPAPTIGPEPTGGGAVATMRRPLAVLSRSLTPNRLGRVSLKLHNPNATAARGRVTIASGRSVLGRAAFGTGAAKSAAVKVRLSRAGRRLLARKRVLRVSVVVTTDAGTSRKTIELRAQR